MLRRLFRSRKFVVGLAALIVRVGVSTWGWPVEIGNGVIALAAAFMATTAIEDAAAKLKGDGLPGGPAPFEATARPSCLEPDDPASEPPCEFKH